MADQNLILQSGAKPKRDSYGFAVRPQHLQRYREYGNIYKEEEEERSEKWKSFLEQCSESAHLYKSAVEDLAKTEVESSDFSKYTSIGGDDLSGEKSTSGGSAEVGTEKTGSVLKEAKRCKIQTWEPIRLSLIPIEKVMSVRIRKKLNLPKDVGHMVEVNLPSMVAERLTKENFKELHGESFLNSDVASQEGWADIESPTDSSQSEHTSNDCHKTIDSSVCPGQKAKTPPNSCQNEVTLSSSSLMADNDGRGESGFGYSVTSELFFPSKEELEFLVHGGIPKSLRGEVWQAFVGVRARRVERYYEELVSVEMDLTSDKNGFSGAGCFGLTTSVPEKLRKQIEKDLPRTFPGHPALNEEGRNSLRRILTAYARHNPSVGYCQAMNFFAGLLLLLMPEENAFWTLVGLIDEYFDGYFTQEMIEAQVDQLVFEELMREKFPKLVNHLDFLGVEVAWVSGTWFLSIFVNMLPWESVLRVWDVVLFEGNRVMLFRTALALMELYGPALVTTKDAGDVLTLLQSLTGSTFDSSQLVLTACMGFLAVTETRLEELRNKHRPSVLGIIEERSKGSEVSRESKSLASKLYSFKHDPQSLVNDPTKNEILVGKQNDSARSTVKASPENFDEFMCGLNIDSLPDLQDQVVWLKVELCRSMEDKRSATLRAEELETAFLEMVRQDNRRQLSARVEQLDREIAQLQQTLADKQEQECAMLQVLMRVEQEQKVTEDARVAAEQDLAAQKCAVYALQEKYEQAMASLAEMEKRVVMAESMLEATLQYESGQAKSVSSPRSGRALSPPQTGKRTGLLSFGLGWRDKNKGRTMNEEEPGESRSIGKSSAKDTKIETQSKDEKVAQPANDVAKKCSRPKETNG